MKIPFRDHSGAEPEPAHALPELPADGFEGELTSALDELGRRVLPHEFDPAAILRRTARRRSCRLLTASAAAIAVVAGATAFAARPGHSPTPAAAPPTARRSASAGTDPLTVPAFFRTMPAGTSVGGFTELGATTFVASDDQTGTLSRVLQTDWSIAGADYTAQVSWFGGKPATTPQLSEGGTAVGTVNGHPAYFSTMPQRQLTFWTGSQGYATLIIFKQGEDDQSATTAELLNVARALDPTPAEAPMPFYVTGLGTAEVTAAGAGWVGMGIQDSAWGAYLMLTVDGRSYRINAGPGPALAPTPTGTLTTTGLVGAEETVDGLGISVTTSSGKQGSPDAPTAAQVLSHVTPLGVTRSNWTTDVIVK